MILALILAWLALNIWLAMAVATWLWLAVFAAAVLLMATVGAMFEKVRAVILALAVFALLMATVGAGIGDWVYQGMILALAVFAATVLLMATVGAIELEWPHVEQIARKRFEFWMKNREFERDYAKLVSPVGEDADEEPRI